MKNIKRRLRRIPPGWEPPTFYADNARLMNEMDLMAVLTSMQLDHRAKDYFHDGKFITKGKAMKVPEIAKLLNRDAMSIQEDITDLVRGRFLHWEHRVLCITNFKMKVDPPRRRLL